MPTNRQTSTRPEDVYQRLRGTAALVCKLAEAEQLGDRGGSNPTIDRDAWNAIEALMLAAHCDAKHLYDEIERRCEQVFALSGGVR
jgi:hypothetical protein